MCEMCVRTRCSRDDDVASAGMSACMTEEPDHPHRVTKASSLILQAEALRSRLLNQGQHLYPGCLTVRTKEERHHKNVEHGQMGAFCTFSESDLQRFCKHDRVKFNVSLN